VDYEIVPEPTEEERAAILAALEEPAGDEPDPGPWRAQEA
jgi:hypothetical protein